MGFRFQTNLERNTRIPHKFLIGSFVYKLPQRQRLKLAINDAKIMAKQIQLRQLQLPQIHGHLRRTAQMEKPGTSQRFPLNLKLSNDLQ